MGGAWLRKEGCWGGGGGGGYWVVQFPNFSGGFKLEEDFVVWQDSIYLARVGLGIILACLEIVNSEK